MSERGADFDAKREAYEAARAELARLIDEPNKALPLDVYRSQLKAAKRKCQRAHGDMLAVWRYPFPR